MEIIASFSATGRAWRPAVAAAAFAAMLAAAAAADAPAPSAAPSDSAGQRQGDASSSSPTQPETSNPQVGVDAREMVKRRMEICRRRPEVCMQSGEEHPDKRGTGEDSRGGVGKD